MNFWSNPNAVTAAATAIFVILWAATRRSGRLSAVIFWGLLFNFVVVALFFAPQYQNIVIGKDIAAQVIGFSLFLLWISHILRKQAFTFTPTPLNIGIMVFFLLSVLSAYFAPRWAWYFSLEEISRTAAVILMFFMVVKFMNTRGRWNAGLYTILACAAITSIYGILQIYGFDFIEWGRIVNVSTFGNKDFFASFLTYTIPIALFLAVGSSNVFDAGLYLLIAGLGLFHIWQGETRGAWLGLVVLIVVTVWFEMKYGRLGGMLGSLKKRLIFWGSVVLGAVILIPFAPHHKIDTFQSIFQAHKGTNIIRVYIWWSSMRMCWDSPLTGQGIGTYQLTYPTFRPDRYHRIGMSHNTRHAHSEQFELLAEQGVVGLAAWLSFLVIFFVVSVHKLKDIHSLTDRYLFYGLVSGLFAGLVHDSINVNLRWMSTATLFWFQMGLAIRYVIGFDPEDRKAARRKVDENGVRAERKEILLGAALASVFAFMFCLEYRVLRSDYLLKIVEGTAENPATQRLGIETGKEVLRLVPYDHSAVYKSAFAHIHQGEYDKAQDAYRRLFALAPNYAQMHQNTAMLAYQDYIKHRERKYLYQAVLEFEWATILENDSANHAKIMQLYAQGMNDVGRARYHNQFLLWNSIEDSFFSWSRYAHSISGPGQSDRDRQTVYDIWIRPVVDFRKDYWLYRIRAMQAAGRTEAEILYATGMAERNNGGI